MADRLPTDLVTCVRDVIAAGYDLHRDNPDLGITGFRRVYPAVSEEHIRANWALFEPYAFDGVRPTSMDAERWRATIACTAATHGLSTIAGERFYRPELLGSELPVAA